MQHLDCASILASQKIKIRDVVVGISNQNRHTSLRALLAGNAVKFQGFGKIVEADVAKRKIAENRGQRFSVVMLQQLLVRSLVKFQGLGEAIAPVVDVAKVYFEPRQAERISLLLEDFCRTPSFGQSLIVASEQQQRLD